MGVSQDQTFKIQGDITLLSPSVPCLYIEENTEGLPTPLAPSLFVVFYDLQGNDGSTLAAPTTGLIY